MILEVSVGTMPCDTPSNKPTVESELMASNCGNVKQLKSVFGQNIKGVNVIIINNHNIIFVLKIPSYIFIALQR